MKQDYVIQASNQGPVLSLLPLQNRNGLQHFFGLKGNGSKPSDPLRGSTKTGSLDMEGDRVLKLRQVHSDRIRIHRKGEEVPFEDTEGHDGVVSDEKGLWLHVFTADCVPLLFYDPHREVGGAVHAGWRGSVAKISEKTIGTLQKEFGCHPEDLLVGIGPSIGPCCYEVGGEVLDKLASAFTDWESWVFKKDPQKSFLNLWEMNRRQLVKGGLREDHIFTTGLCTYCRPELFFSYRRDGPGMGKMVSGVMIHKGSGE